ncbi:MAG TPA: ATP synthase F1 subunit delta [Acidimicrobiales bacterium]|nr:ATP synthase F1 subunit delta [Acidimicrobiales bacterium]
MRAVIRGYASAALESASAAGRLPVAASDLAGFARALTAHDRLREVLMDDAFPATARAAVVAELLEGRASPEGGALLRFTVRYEEAGELPPTLAELTETADHAVETGVDLGSQPEPEGSRSEVRDRIRGYSERVLSELGASDDVDEVEDELFRIARLVDQHADLRRVIGNPSAELAGRLAIVDDLLASRVRPATLRFVRYVLRAGHVRDLVGTLEWLVELAALERGRRLAEARVAVDLDDGERTRLAAALGRLVDRPVEVRVVIDPNVIGGMLVSVGDLVIDGTVRLRLERLHDLLSAVG